MASRRDDDEYDIDGVGERQTKHQTEGRASITVPSGLSLWRPKKAGSHNIDIIPFHVTDSIKRFRESVVYTKPGKWWYERTFYNHQGIGINNESFTCVARTFDKPCPVCEARAKYLESPHKEDQKAAKDLKPKERQLFLIYDYDDHDKGVQLWEVSYHLFGKQLDEYIDGARKTEKEAYGRFYHPKEGYEIRITGREESMGEGGKPFTKWSIHQFYEREREIPKKFIDHGYDLDAMVKEIEYDALKKIYVGDEDEVESRRDSRRSRDDDDRQRSRDDRDSRRSRDDDDDRGGRSRSRRDDRDDRDSRDSRDRGDDRDSRRSRDDDDDRPRRREESRNGDSHDDPPRKREEPKEEKPVSRPVPKGGYASKDIVKFEMKGEWVQGEVSKVDAETGVVEVTVEGRERPVRLDADELVLVKQDKTFDKKPSEKPEKSEEKPAAKEKESSKKKDKDKDKEKDEYTSSERAKDKKWEDDDDDGRTRKPKTKAAASDDDDDRPPSRKK